MLSNGGATLEIGRALAMIRHRSPVRLDDKRVRSFTAPGAFIAALLDLLIDGERGIWHLVHPGPATLAGLARLAAREAELEPALILPRFATAAEDEADRILASVRGWPMAPLERIAAEEAGAWLEAGHAALHEHRRFVEEDLIVVPPFDSQGLGVAAG
jgi:hypothetical protein